MQPCVQLCVQKGLDEDTPEFKSDQLYLIYAARADHNLIAVIDNSSSAKQQMHKKLSLRICSFINEIFASLNMKDWWIYSNLVELALSL